MIGADADMNPWTGEPGLTEQQMLWRERERERRQRSSRLLMMFMLMLLLMDGEEQSRRRHPHDRTQLRKTLKATRSQGMDQSVYTGRLAQDEQIRDLVNEHPSYQRLVAKNGEDLDSKVRVWAEQLDNKKGESAKASEPVQNSEEDPKAWHYPWNSTGFYRGDWQLEHFPSSDAAAGVAPDQPSTPSDISREGDQQLQNQIAAKNTVFNTSQLEASAPNILQAHQDSVGVFLLPPGFELKLPNSSLPGQANSTSETSSTRIWQQGTVRGAETRAKVSQAQVANISQITLSKSSGKAAFQLYSRTVPAMKELSIVDGLVKLYDSDTIGYSTQRDILLRVRGVLIHSLGKISLVATNSLTRSALFIANNKKEEHHRRLAESFSAGPESDALGQLRDDVLSLHASSAFDPAMPDATQYDSVIKTFEEDIHVGEQYHRRLGEVSGQTAAETDSSEDDAPALEHQTGARLVVPYPYVSDDGAESLKGIKTPADRSMPPREQDLLDNAGVCEFEINLSVEEEEWTTSKWRNLLSKRARDTLQLNPTLQEKADQDTEPKKAWEGTASRPRGASGTKRSVRDEALVMTMNGTIVSPNCHFKASLNATAIRIDWDLAQGKATTYSFCMMLTCLAQIVLLLKQLIHTQSATAAVRVSLWCIGWNATLDSLLCLAHMYLSLSMQPLFTAFASVAFFKLLIVCVIEMKYIAIITQARSANTAGNTAETQRRNVSRAHVRFYVALMVSLILLQHAWGSYRTLYLFVLYSFWVPQIVQNVVTESKRPLHQYFVYGISATRLVAPLYIFAVRNSFLRVVYPDDMTDPFLCQVLVVWVAIQTIVLEAQGRYGARFMIPARFLPPKFDYNRPIPAYLLPRDVPAESPSEELQNERGSPSSVRSLKPKDSSPPRPTGGARNRIKGSRANRAEHGMTTETVSSAPAHVPLPSFDCVICYSEIDIRNNSGYMLAPCDHLFHKECLVQWMDVKRECPICRTELPSL